MQRRQLLIRSATLLSAGIAGAGRSAIKPEGFMVPAEEQPHACTFMQWPVDRRVYRDAEFLDQVQSTIAQIANSISAFEPVILLAAKEHHPGAKARVSQQVELWDVPTEDLWCRDSGPLFATDSQGQLVVSHLQFNGWGAKQVHTNDARVAGQVAERLGTPLIGSGLVGEAGGVEHDGHGLLLAHESSWYNDNRNPGLSRQVIEQRLLRAYGAQRIIWSDGLWGEDITDYHIDSLARLTGSGRVLMNLPDQTDPDDPFHAAALMTHDRLVAADLDIDVIPEPHYPRVRSLDFVASYANFYVCNGAVIAAQFGDETTDDIAHQTLARHYPGREVVMLNVDALGMIGGGIHCATQQMPEV